MSYSFPGERPAQSRNLQQPQRQLPGHLGPEKDQCMIVPVRRVYRCSETGTEEIVTPGEVRCCNPDHDHSDHPCAAEPEINEWAEEIPGWTVQSLRTV